MLGSGKRCVLATERHRVDVPNAQKRTLKRSRFIWIFEEVVARPQAGGCSVLASLGHRRQLVLSTSLGVDTTRSIGDHLYSATAKNECVEEASSKVLLSCVA